MNRKIIVITVMLLLFTAKSDGSTKVEWIAASNFINPNSTLQETWDTGFQFSGDWSLNPHWFFVLQDKVSINNAVNDWTGSLNRCFLRYENNTIRLDIGRQAIGWGIGWFFRPMDVITPLTVQNSEESRVGRDLAALRWSTSALTNTELIAGKDIMAGYAELQIDKTNLRFFGVTNQNGRKLIGADFRGGLNGFYGEMRFDWQNAMNEGKLACMLGKQYNFGNNRLLNLEYFHNNGGEKDPSLYNFSLISIDNPYLAQNYFGAGYQIPVDELTVVFLTAIINLDDKSAMLGATVIACITDNIDLQGGATVFIGDPLTEFRMLVYQSSIGLNVKLKYYF